MNVFWISLVIDINYKNGLSELQLIWIKYLICSTSPYILYDVGENFPFMKTFKLNLLKCSFILSPNRFIEIILNNAEINSFS